MDPLVKADRCAQYVDDIGIAANTPDELIENVELVFQQQSKAGLKLSMNKCEIGQKQNEYLGKLISSTGIAPIEKRITDYLKKLKPLNSVRALQRYLGFVSFYRSYIPRLADTTAVLHELPKKDADFKLEQRHKDVIYDINESLLKAAMLSLKLALPEKHSVLMCDASEHAAGYVLLIEDYCGPQGKSLKKYAPVAFGSKKFQGGQMSLTLYAKEFLAMQSAFDKFGYILWGTNKPIIVIRDNKALIRSFHARHIPPSLWNFCDQTLQFNFILAHVPGVENPAVDYLSRLEIRPDERVHLKLTDSIPVHHIEVDIASKTPKQEEDEPDYFSPGEPLRRKQSHDAKPMKVIESEPVASDDDKPMNRVEPASITSENDHKPCPQTYQLKTDAQLPTYTKFISKTSLLAPVTKEVSPSGEFDLILNQKTNSDIQLMLKFLSGENTLNHPVNVMSTFFEKLYKNTKTENALKM